MYEHILNELSGVIPNPDNGFSTYASCDNANDFMRHLKHIIGECADPTHTVYIVSIIFKNLISMLCLHCCCPKWVIKLINGLDCEVDYGLDFSPLCFTVPDDDGVLNLCLTSI